MGEQKADSSPTAIPRILEEGNQAECEKSTHSAQKVDSSTATTPSLRALLRKAWQSIKKHTNPLESTFENTTNVSEQPKDSRICDEKSLLCEPRKEIRLECLSTQRGDAIKDLSRKAESLAKKILLSP